MDEQATLSIYIGRRVAVTVSDPWDLTTDNRGDLLGTIADIADQPVHGIEIAIHLDQPLRVGLKNIDNIYWFRRHANTTLDDIFSGKIIPSNFIHTPEQIDGHSPRGFIGSLQLI